MTFFARRHFLSKVLKNYPMIIASTSFLQVVVGGMGIILKRREDGWISEVRQNLAEIFACFAL